MTPICLWLLPVFGALIGSVCAFICSKQLKAQLNSVFNPQLRQDLGNGKIIEGEIEAIISQHLDDLVVSLKSQIPMASMLLGQSREEKLKAEARQELFKAVPALVELIEEQTAPPLLKLTTKLWRSVTFSLMTISALVGALIGLIQLGIFSLLCN